MISAHGVAKLVQAVANVLGSLMWPLLVLYIVIRFGRNISELIESIGSGSLKFAGIELNLQKQTAAAALTVAAISRPRPGATPEDTSSVASEAVRAVGGVSRKQIRIVEGSKILWVDDRPDNNIFERQSLEALGLKFVISKSTEEALHELVSQRFKLIISDMGRPPDDQAGYTLLKKLRASGIRTPYIIYAGLNSAEHREMAISRGAVGSTNDPTELFEMVLSTLQDTY